MNKGQLLYEGKAKRLYTTEDSNILFVEYKDSATAFNGEKKEEIAGKGVLNNRITTLIFEKLQSNGIASHFVKRISDHEQLVRKVEIIPIELVVRNIAAGSLAKRLGLEEGIKLIQSMEGYSAFFITKDKKIYSVNNVNFALTETGLNNYELIEIE